MKVDILDVRSLAHPGELKPTVILLSSVIILAVQRQFGCMEFGARLFTSGNGLVLPLYMFATVFLLFGVVPFAIVTLLFRERPSDYGIRVGNWRQGITAVGILMPIIAVAFLLPGAHTEEVRAFFPFAQEAKESVAGFFFLQVPRILLFYSAWEFLFRGFMLFGLRPYVGDWLAICIQTIPACLWHIGMPTGELITSIAASLIFGIIALRTNSILWPFMLHLLIGVVLDIFIIFNL